MLITLWTDVCFFVRTTRHVWVRVWGSLNTPVCAAVCASGHVQPGLHMGVNALVLIARVSKCACDKCVVGGGLCNVNKQRQQQQQLRWLPRSLSYVVIRSGWKCGTTVAFHHNQTFLSGRGLQTETDCGLLSSLLSPGHLSSATGHLSLQPRCVIRPLSTTRVTHPLCIRARMGERALPICHPPVCAASHWLGTIPAVTLHISSNCVSSWETNKPKS